MIRLRGGPLPPLVAILLVATFLSPAFGERRRGRGGRNGWLEVVSSTVGADIFVDGERVGEVPLEDRVELPPGEHSIKVSKRGYTQHLEVVSIRRRKTTVVEADLLALSGVIRVVASVEDARVFIDGDYVGDAPLDHDVDPGERAVKVAARGYYDFERTVEVVAGEEAEVAAELERLPPEEDPTIAPPPRQREVWEQWWFWTAISAAVVAAVAIAVPLGVVYSQTDPCERAIGWRCEDGIPFEF